MRGPGDSYSHRCLSVSLPSPALRQSTQLVGIPRKKHARQKQLTSVPLAHANLFHVKLSSSPAGIAVGIPTKGREDGTLHPVQPGGPLLPAPSWPWAGSASIQRGCSGGLVLLVLHGCGSCSRTWGEEPPRLITPARAGLAGLFLTVLIEAGFLLTFTLLHRYRLPSFQPPRLKGG